MPPLRPAADPSASTPKSAPVAPTAGGTPPALGPALGPVPGVQLIWPGKLDAAGRRRTPEATTAGRCEVVRAVGPGGSVNRLIHGDFRQVLPMLPAQSIDFVYVDPPFRTRRDHYITGLRGGLHIGASNGASNGAKPRAAYADRLNPAAYLNFLDDLIQMVRPALRPTGSIALHVDHRASAHARCLLDEHFGPQRFINELIWKYGLGNATASRHFLRKHDSILVYGKSARHYFNKQRGEVTAAQQRKYCHEDAGGRYMMSYGKRYNLKGGKPLESILDIPALAATDAQRCGYPTQKPLRLLEVLIESLCPPGGVVMDPCCGSGTTAVAAQQSGRAWIACDESATAIELATQRLEAEAGCGFVVERVG